MNSSFVPSLVLEYAVFFRPQDATKPLMVMGRGKDGGHLIWTSGPQRAWERHQPSGPAEGGWGGGGVEKRLHPPFPGSRQLRPAVPAAATFLQAAASWSRAWGLAWSLSSPDVPCDGAAGTPPLLPPPPFLYSLLCPWPPALAAPGKHLIWSLDHHSAPHRCMRTINLSVITSYSVTPTRNSYQAELGTEQQLLKMHFKKLTFL